MGMGAPQWEVRNGASLAYTTLLLRMLGVRNLAKVKAPLPVQAIALTGDEMRPIEERV